MKQFPDDFLEKRIAARAARRADVTAEYEAGVREWEGRPGWYIAVTPEPGGGFRATQYLVDGLYGHMVRERLERLLDDITDDGYCARPAPGTFDQYGAVQWPPTAGATL